ncbi:MAG: hypothetical protein ACD_77C00145G0007, partial [uncultured bacterium]
EVSITKMRATSIVEELSDKCSERKMMKVNILDR